MALCFAKLPREIRGSCLLLTPRHTCGLATPVTFSLAADRADFAVDLEIIKEKAAISSATAEVGLQSILEKAAKPASSFAKQPTRKLQRSIARFHNADLEERLQMIEAAESLLSDLLNAVELDGDAVCKLLCRCAGWLHAPGSFEAKHVAAEVAASEVATVSQLSGPSDLQCRVRRLLISALSSLDLGDITTYQAVETAVRHILQLMQGERDLVLWERQVACCETMAATSTVAGCRRCAAWSVETEGIT